MTTAVSARSTSRSRWLRAGEPGADTEHSGGRHQYLAGVHRRGVRRRSGTRSAIGRRRQRSRSPRTGAAPSTCAASGSTGLKVVTARVGTLTATATLDVRVRQTISFPTIGARTMLQSPVVVSATASSGLPVTFTTTTPDVCTAGGLERLVDHLDRSRNVHGAGRSGRRRAPGHRRCRCCGTPP